VKLVGKGLLEQTYLWFIKIMRTFFIFGTIKKMETNAKYKIQIDFNPDSEIHFI